MCVCLGCVAPEGWKRKNELWISSATFRPKGGPGFFFFGKIPPTASELRGNPINTAAACLRRCRFPGAWCTSDTPRLHPDGRRGGCRPWKRSKRDALYLIAHFWVPSLGVTRIIWIFLLHITRGTGRYTRTHLGCAHPRGRGLPVDFERHGETCVCTHTMRLVSGRAMLWKGLTLEKKEVFHKEGSQLLV